MREDPGSRESLAWFDAGYVIEALSELEQVGHYEKQLRGLETVLAGLTDSLNGRALFRSEKVLVIPAHNFGGVANVPKVVRDGQI